MKNPVFWASALSIFLATVVTISLVWIFKIDLSLWLTVIGTFITAVAFSFGTFFAVLAVDAYGHTSVLRNAEKDMSKARSELSDLNSKFYNFQNTSEEAVRKIEAETFDKLAVFLKAMVEFVQKLPIASKAKNDEHQKCVSEFVSTATGILGEYMCNHSRDSKIVQTQLMQLYGVKHERIKEIARGCSQRFPDDEDIVSLCRIISKE
jgi:hypothetical protein